MSHRPHWGWRTTECEHTCTHSPLHIWEHISSWQPWLQRWSEEPHLESPGNFSCLANSHMCQTLPPTRHISHIPQECLLFFFLSFFFFFNQVKRMNPKLHCVCVCLFLSLALCSFWRSFYGTVSSCAICSLPSHQFFFSRPIETRASPSEYLCLHGLTIKRASLCFHFLSDSGNPDQGLELWPCFSP